MGPSPIYVDILLALFVAGLGAAYALRLFRKGVRLSAPDAPRQAKGLVVAGLGFIFGNAVFLPLKEFPSVAWYLPILIEYYLTPLGWTIELSLMTFAIAGISMLSFLEHHRARWILIGMSLVFFICAESLFQNYARDVVPDTGNQRISADGLLLQTSGSTCAPTACANVARFFGKEISEKEMVELLGTKEHGTSPAQIIYGMQKLGFMCKKRYIHNEDIAQLHTPAILLVNWSNEVDGHVVVYNGIMDEKAEIWDPVSGKYLLKLSLLNSKWHGRAIEISKKNP
jgi:hypothetical protein